METRTASCGCGRRRTGSAFAEVAGFPLPYTVSGQSTACVRTGDAVGAFADPGFPAPQISVYGSRRHSWVRLPPGVQAFERDPS